VAERQQAGDMLLRVEQLDALEAITAQITASLLAIRESAHTELERMLRTEGLLRHLTRPQKPQDIAALPVC
jgi:hypothetical protein